MSVFRIQGGKPLFGRVSVHGAKNSVLPILAATLVSGRKSVIRNCPRLSDVEASVKILRHLGCTVEVQDDTLVIDSGPMNRHDIPDCLMREMRSSVVFLGAILARCGEACMSFPGGCELGPRPIDLHLAALREMGCEVTEEAGNLICRSNGLHGCEINLSLPSVGATENIMLAATAANGTTRITNAAREPEIMDLQDFLCEMGVSVRGAGTSTVVIDGMVEPRDTEHSVIADRIVAATYLSIAASAGGDVLVADIVPQHLAPIVDVLREAGADLTVGEDTIRIVRKLPLRAVRPVRTAPYPGFPTDAQSPLMAALACAEGTTVFMENIFENRFRHVSELHRMGADIRVEGRVAVVCGVPYLVGAKVESTDLRGGAAMLVAGLGARGETTVSGLHHIDRGYDRLIETLTGLGAEIERVEEDC